MAALNPLPADLTLMIQIIAEIRRETAVRRFQSDSMVVQVARDIERERLAAITGYHYWEGGRDGSE
jgi:hypothetical protein